MTEERVFEIYKLASISVAHQLQLPYESKCNTLHGHNYIVEVWVSGHLNEQGMVMDYTDISKIIKKYDHQNLNDWLNYDSTAELFVELIFETFKNLIKSKEIRNIRVIRIRVSETDTTYAELELTLEQILAISRFHFEPVYIPETHAPEHIKKLAKEKGMQVGPQQ